MSSPVNTILDFENRNRITNLAPAVATGQPTTLEQVLAMVEKLPWKDDARAASTANVNLAAPGATMDGVTLVSGDRAILKDQTTQTENGIYIWNGAAVALTRALDASTFDELEAAVLYATEGTSNAGTKWRQTQVNGVIGTNVILWSADQSSAPAASETTAGILEVATQAETDTGTDDARALTPLKGKSASWMLKKASVTFGNGSLTSNDVSHNLNRTGVHAEVWEVAGSKRRVLAEIQELDANTIRVITDLPPASNAYKLVVIG